MYLLVNAIGYASCTLAPAPLLFSVLGRERSELIVAIIGSELASGISGLLRNHIGFVPNPLSKRSQTLGPRIREAQVFDSICPYCAVGCSQKVYVKDGHIIDIEDIPESPISAGHLCAKGAATYQLTVNPNQPRKVLYRAPRGDHWEERPLAWAMERERPPRRWAAS